MRGDWTELAFFQEFAELMREEKYRTMRIFVFLGTEFVCPANLELTEDFNKEFDVIIVGE